MVELLERLYRAAPDFYLWLVDELAKHRAVSRKALLSSYLIQDGCREARMLESYYSFLMLYAVFGEEGAKRAVGLYLSCGMEGTLPFEPLYRLLFGNDRKHMFYSSLKSYQRLKPVRSYEPEAFLTYLFQKAARAGFSGHLEEYLTLWEQALSMQELLDGSVADLYPDHLASEYCRLFSRMAKDRERVEENAWRPVLERMRKYEYANDAFELTCPASMAAFRQQCLPGQRRELGELMKNLLDGSCMVFFPQSKEAKALGFAPFSMLLLCEEGGLVRVSEMSMDNSHSFAMTQFIIEWLQEKGLEDYSIVYEERMPGFPVEW